MKRKKIALGLVSLMSVFTLAACSGGKEVASMKGGKITVEDFYEEIKTDQNTQGMLRNMIIYKVAENEYADKVDDKEIDKQFNETKKELGDKFKSQLEANGLTEASFKENLKKQYAFKEMLTSHVKVKDEDLKEAWKTYHPEVSAQVIVAQTAEEATALLDRVKNGEDFGEVAKTDSKDQSATKNGKVTFDSTDVTTPAEVKEASYKLKDGDVSEVITATISNGYQSSEAFYIVKMNKNKEKGNDMKPFKKTLTEIVKNEKMGDPAFQNEVIADELTKANVKISDDSMKGILAGFIEEEDSKDKKKENKSEDTKNKKKDTKKEDKKEETDSSSK